MAPSTPLHAGLPDVSNVLVKSPSMSGNDETACMELLTGTDPDSTAVVSILLSESGTAHLRTWDRHVGQYPKRIALIDVGQVSRPSFGKDRRSLAANVDRKTVKSPSALTDLGVAVTDRLSEYADSECELAVCFDSITPLLQYVDLPRALRFFDVLTDRVAAVDATAHYHLDPGAHDEDTVDSLQSLFGAVVSVSDDDYTIRR